jgi:hypothetical protein
MENPKLALIPSGYKSGKVYSILPVDGVGDFDFNRSSESSRVNKNGLIETVSNNAPKLNWLNSDCPSLLLEPQRTNYATNSNDASQWGNVSGSQSITKTQNYSIAPDGTQTATRLQATATGSNYSLIQLSTTSITGDYAGSVYLKSNTGNTENVIVYGRNTPVTSYTINNEWQRIEFQGSSTSGQNSYLFLGSFPNNGSDESIDVLVWGGQLEAGSYATSYIKTEASAVTRLKDICNNAGDSQLLNNKENTFFIDLNKIYKTKTTDSRISFNDNSATNRFLFSTQTNDTTIILYSIRGNSVTTIKYFSVDYDARNKIACTLKDNEIKFYVNGAKVHEALFLPIPLNLSNISFDENNNGSRTFQGEVNGVRYYDRVLTEAEAIKLTK